LIPAVPQPQTIIDKQHSAFTCDQEWKARHIQSNFRCRRAISTKAALDHPMILLTIQYRGSV
jgi:hypothetical protein